MILWRRPLPDPAEPPCPHCGNTGVKREGTNGWICSRCPCPAGQAIRSYRDLDIAMREEGCNL